MRRQPFRFVWFVGLCSAALSGCANLRWTGDDGRLGSDLTAATDGSSANSAPGFLAGLLVAGAEAEDAAESGQSRDAMLEGQFALGRLCERRGESQQAEQVYLALLRKAPQDVRLHHRLGVLAVKKGDFARAEEYFNEARSLAPPTAELLADVGYCYYLQQKLPEAEEVLGEALKLDPAYVTATNNLALVLGAEGRFQESLNLFKRANSEAEAYANLAYVLALHGESARAEQMYLRALTLDNTMRAAAQAMLQIDQRRCDNVSFSRRACPPGDVPNDSCPGPTGKESRLNANAT